MRATKQNRVSLLITFRSRFAPPSYIIKPYKLPPAHRGRGTACQNSNIWTHKFGMMGYNVLSKISHKDWLYPIFGECTELEGVHVGGERDMEASHPHVTKNVDYARTRRGV